jgi:hypothetical protein
MPKLYAIPCSFKLTQDGPIHKGLAICSDPDKPITFIFPNGKPYIHGMVWSYVLKRYEHLAAIEVGEG